MACGQTGDHSLPYQGPIVGYRYHLLWCVRPLDSLAGNMSHMRVILLYNAKHLDSCVEMPPSEEFELCRTRGILSKGARQACRPLVNRVWLLVPLTDHS